MAKLNLDKNIKEGLSIKEKRHMFIMVIALLMLVSILVRPFFIDKKRPVKQPMRVFGKQGEREPDFPVVEAQTRPVVKTGEEDPEKAGKSRPSLTPGQKVGDPEVWKNREEGETVTFDEFNQAVEIVCDYKEEELEKAVLKKEFPSVDQSEYNNYRGKIFLVKGYFLDGPQLVPVSLKKEVIRKLPYVAKMYRGVLKMAGSEQRIACVGTGIFEGYIMDRPVYFHGVFAGMEKIPKGDSTEVVPLFVYKQLHLVEVNPVAGTTEFKPGLKLGSDKIWDIADDRLYDVIERDPYYHGIEILVNISQEDLTKCIDPALTYPEMIRLKNNPSQHRGKVFRLKGRLLRLEEKEVDRDRAVCKKLPHYPIIFVGQILESSTKKPYTFRALDIPRDLIVGDYVEMIGVFVKRYTYQNRRGENWYTKTPLVMGKRITKFERVFHLMSIVGAVGIGVFILIVAAALYERKRYMDFKKRMKGNKDRKRTNLISGSDPESAADDGDKKREDGESEKQDDKDSSEEDKETEDDQETGEDKREESKEDDNEKKEGNEDTDTD